MLALPSQIFEHLPETFCRRAFVEYLQSARSKKANRKGWFPTETPDLSWPFWRPAAVGGDTFSSVAPVLGPEQRNWLLCHPLPLFIMTVSMSLLINMWLSSRWCMTVSMSLLINMWLSRRWCKRHSCGREFPSFNLNQLVSVPDFVLNVKFPGLGGKSCFVFCFSRGGVSKKKREIREKLLRWWRSSS